MATRYWQGTTDDWDTTTNWSSNDTPDDGDDVIFPASSRQSLLRNLDRTGDSAGAGLHLNSIYVHPGYRGQIGTSATPLKCTVSGTVKHRGAMPFYWASDTGSGGNTSGTVYVASASRAPVAMYIGGAAAVTRLMASDGSVLVQNTTGVSNFHCMRSPSRIGGAHVTFGTSLGAVTSADVSGGVTEISATGWFTYVSGGRVTFHPGSSCTGLEITGSASVDYRSTTTIPIVYLGGRLDLRRLTGPLTITDLYRLGGGTILYDPELVTITNDYQGVSA